MRRAVLQWMNDELQLASSAPLRFNIPLLRWTQQADDVAYEAHIAAYEHTTGDQRVRAAIWSAAGYLLHQRKGKDTRPHIRLGLRLLRRAWLAHCAGRRDLRTAEFNAAAIERTQVAALGAEAARNSLAKLKRRTIGKRSHRGKPERLTDKIAKAIAANPGVSNAKIAAIVGTSESSVQRRRQR